jgi:hypothetical protein
LIHVARDQVRPPSPWLERSDQELAKATAFYSGEAAFKSTKQFPFQLYRTSNTRRLLEDLFRGKCAFCESRIDVVNTPDVETRQTEESSRRTRRLALLRLHVWQDR